MRVAHHFVSYGTSSARIFANQLVNDLESRGLPCWLNHRDLADQFHPLEQIDEALRRCSSLIVILAEQDSHNELSASEWRRALAYNKAITVVRPFPGIGSPLLLDTRRLIDFSGGYNEALKSLADRLCSLATPAGQLETLREQLTATERASHYATAANKARFLSEISALEQQIAALSIAPVQEHITYERIASSLELERRPPIEHKSVPKGRLRIVNAPPLPVPRYFENRTVETGLICDFLRDDAACILTVHGRGGVGKTAMVCRVLRQLEDDSFPENLGMFKVASMVYVNATRASSTLFPTLLSGLVLTLDQKDEPLSSIDNPNANAVTKLREVLSRLPSDPTVVLLDNFEDVLSTEGAIKDAEMAEFLKLLSEHPRHSLKVIVTTRIVPSEILSISPGRQMRISLTDGLSSPYAEMVLRKLDADGSVGLKNASDLTLHSVAKETRGFPRALEAFYSILAADPTREIEDVISDLRSAAFPAEKLTQALVGEAYSRLLPIDQKVMQVLAIFARPASVNAIEYLLDEWAPYVDTAAVLRRLVAMHFVRREAPAYYLHPIDREHSLSFLTDIDKQRLRGRAANYYREIGRPRSEWKVLADIEAHLEQFQLRLETDDVETAESILSSISDFLDKRGAFEQLLSLAQALNRSVTDQMTTISALKHIAHAQWRLGRLSEAVTAQRRMVELLEQDDFLTDDFSQKDNFQNFRRELRRLSNPTDSFIEKGNLLIFRQDLERSEELIESFREYTAEFERRYPSDFRDLATCLHHFAECLGDFGYLNEALVHQERALDLASRTLDCDHKEAQIHNLGNRYDDLGQVQKAEDLYQQALALADENNNPLWRANHLSALADCAQLQGRFEEAQKLITSALEIRQEIGDLGGIARNMQRQSQYLLTMSELEQASDFGIKAFERARDLKLPLRAYRRVRSEILLAEGKTAEAYRVLTEGNDEESGARWDFDNLRGTLLLANGHIKLAENAFARALTQSELWLSRSESNLNARAGKALALAGMAACGDSEALERSKNTYRDAINRDPGSGRIAMWKARLQRLLANQSHVKESELLSVLGYAVSAKEESILKKRQQVFISYAREDKRWLEKLIKVLSPAIRNNRIDVWYDAKIKPGQKWREEIDAALERVAIGVILVSPDFLASDFINDKELPYLLEAADRKGVRLLWIYLTPCLLEEAAGISELQCAHDPDQTLDSLTPPELSKCMVSIAREIKTAWETDPQKN